MPKKILRRFIPNIQTIKNQKQLQLFGTLLHDPNLWHLNRYCVATAFSVGLFVAFVPIPFQMVLAAAIAIIVRANLPISVALVWISNPLTMPPLFFFAFKLGALILNRQPTGFHFELSFHWLMTGFQSIWAPFLLGCFILGSTLAIIGNMSIRLIWRYLVSRNWRARKNRKLKHL